MVGYEDPTFLIKSGDMGFLDRQKNIFDKITVAEKERNDRQNQTCLEISGKLHSDSKLKLSRKRCRSEMKQFRGKESIFKRPDMPPPRLKNKGVPDYHKNPHKWVKYSLADVSQEDMSDKSNTAAALSFLKELQDRKGQEKMEVEYPSQVTFKQPKNKARLMSCHDSTVSIISKATCTENSIESEDKPSFKSSKLIMPEYIVGITKKREKEKKQEKEHLSVNENITSKISLGHLMEEDNE